MQDRQSLLAALVMARRSLAILEQQAAGFTALTRPAHLAIDLEEKRKEVERLEQRLAALDDQAAPPAAEATTPSEAQAAAIRVFLSYGREDQAQVEALYRRLKTAGFRPWMDTQDLLPGEQWPLAIRDALGQAHFVLVCLSARSVNRRGYLQREIRMALDALQELLDSDIFLIPVRLEETALPEALSRLQWVDLFAPDGFQRLVRAIWAGWRRRN